jgi:hypothetical protein
VTTPDEEQQLDTLRRALEIVPEWVRLTDIPQPPLVPGSDLAYDDRRTHPYRVSHAAWGAMLAAVSHFACLRDSLFHWSAPDRVDARIQTHGQFSLVRGGLENASRVVWMLESDDPDQRQLRRLRLEWAESRQQDFVRQLMGPLGKGKSKKERLDELTALLPPVTTDPDQIKLKQKAIRDTPDYVIIVKAAGEHLPTGSSLQEFIWRTCSALAHGDYRGTLGYMAREVLPLPGPTHGIELTHFTASVPLLTTGSLVAIETMKEALRLYGKRTM